MFDVKGRLEHLLSQLETEIDILQVEKRIRGRVKRQMEKSQREYYLNEQVKAIQKELGEGEEGADLEEMEKRIKRAHMHKEARKKAESELKKLKLMSPMSAEATVVRNYIETLVNLPWKKKSRISKDIKQAQAVLDKDHYGLEKVKERIVEYLAVQTRVDKMKAPILTSTRTHNLLIFQFEIVASEFPQRTANESLAGSSARYPERTTVV